MKKNINGKDKEKEKNGAAILLKRAAYIIDAERSQMNMAQRELAEAIGVSQTTINNWINRDMANAHPNLHQLLKLCCAINMSLDELFKSIAAADKNEKEKLPEDIYNDLQSFVGILKKDNDASKSATGRGGRIGYKEYEAIEIDASYDRTENHISRINAFANKRYVALYFDHLNRSDNPRINRLNITTEGVDERGFCPFTMTINDNPNVRYSGKIVSPPNNYYAYFYFAGGDPNERGICVLFHASYFIGEYHCGAGLLLSISTANRYPAVQRIAIIEENVYHAIACTESFDIIKQILKKDFQKNDGPIICLPEMQKEHNILYKVIEPFVSSGS